MKPLMLNCLAQREKIFAISKRFAAGQSAAIASSSGSSTTREDFIFMRINLIGRVGHWLSM